MDFNISLNLQKLKGAQCLTVTMPDGKKLDGIFIPSAYNDMVRTSKQTGAPEIVPYLNLRVRAANQKFVEACIRNHAGEDGYQAPTHTVDVSFSKEFRERAIASASKRVAAEHPEYTPEQVEQEAKRAVYITLGTMAPVEQRGYTPSVAAAAAYIQPATAPDGGASAPSPSPVGPAPLAEDDLPF